ncbi:MAG: hypothetical protein U0441_14890 [Polyangiaceae bacterium]
MRQLAVKLQEDFTLRNVGAEVVFGNWSVEQHAGADRVILGLGDFDPASAGVSTANRPGVVLQTGVNTASQVVSVHAQEVLVWVHGVAPEGTAEIDVPALSHDRTGVLLHATIAGLLRVVGRGALAFGKGTWPTAAQGDVTYGALARLKCMIDVPVLGDAWSVVPKPYSVTTQVVAELPGGDVVASEATTPTPPDPP